MSICSMISKSDKIKNNLSSESRFRLRRVSHSLQISYYRSLKKQTQRQGSCKLYRCSEENVAIKKIAM